MLVSTTSLRITCFSAVLTTLGLLGIEVSPLPVKITVPVIRLRFANTIFLGSIFLNGGGSAYSFLIGVVPVGTTSDNEDEKSLIFRIC